MRIDSAVVPVTLLFDDTMVTKEEVASFQWVWKITAEVILSLTAPGIRERAMVRWYDEVDSNRNRNKEIDTIAYKESLGMSCFQGFFTV